MIGKSNISIIDRHDQLQFMRVTEPGLLDTAMPIAVSGASLVLGFFGVNGSFNLQESLEFLGFSHHGSMDL